MEKIMNLREISEKIIKDSLERVNPKYAIKRYVSYNLRERKIRVKEREFEIKGDLYLISVGKASFPMTEGIIDILGDVIKKGYIVVPYGYEGIVKNNIEVLYSSHPIPDENGERSAKIIYDFVKNLKEDDILIFLLSGGGSALLPLPKEGISLKDKIETTKLLLSCSARIQEINAVRKHLSMIKGGQLAEICKGTIITLIISDVLGNPLDSIASGPTVPDPTTYNDVYNILKKYDIWEKVPEKVREIINKGMSGEIPETPKSVDERHYVDVILSNRDCLEKAIESAKDFGFNTLLISGFLEGEAREVAKVIAGIVKEIKYSCNPISPPCALIFGGETTVTIRGNGLGGRNQELALSFAIEIAGMEGVFLTAFATDGRDGPCDSAGAFADGTTVKRAQELGMDPISFLLNNDSYHFFEKLNDLIKTGPTHTNVNDIIIVLIK
jgi:glycerate-2-kinase